MLFKGWYLNIWQYKTPRKDPPEVGHACYEISLKNIKASLVKWRSILLIHVAAMADFSVTLTQSWTNLVGNPNWRTVLMAKIDVGRPAPQV